MAFEKILLVEDDERISKLIQYNLEKSGYESFLAMTGESAFDILGKNRVDLILLDVMLPGMDGFEICKILKKDKDFSDIPIIMLTARGEEIDRIVGLELGAQDYVVKPFSPRELILRIKAILALGNTKTFDGDVLVADRLRVDISRHKVFVDNDEVELTQMEFNLLVVLMRRVGRVQSRERLLNDVWDISADVTTRTVDTHVKRLRQKLGVLGELIETVRGIGYRFSEKDDGCD